MRRRFNEFVDRHEVAWELGMAVLAILYVAVGFAIDQIPSEPAGSLLLAETALTIVFAAEFASRFAASYDRTAYLRGHWIDLLALLPPVRGARVLRLLRLLRLIRAFSGIYRATRQVERIAGHRGLAWLVVLWLGVMGLTAGAMYVAEKGINTAIDTPFDAVWWGITTMTTVGYGDVYPTTAMGRVAAIALMLLGIGLYSAVTASVASYFVSEDRAPSSATVASELERITVLRDRGALTEAEFASAKAAVLS